MAKTDRLLELMQLMRTLPTPVTASQLAEELEVSERTVYRYIDNLRAAGAVIDGEAGYGYAVVEDPAMPPMMLNADEIEALVLGLREVEEIGDPILAKAARNVLSKVTASLPNRMQKQLEHSVLNAKKFHKRPEFKIEISDLRQVTRDELEIEIGYSDVAKNETRRCILPLSIVFMDRGLVLISYCQLRRDFRAFRIDRMQWFKRTGNSFQPKRVPLLRDALAKFKADAKDVISDVPQ